MTSISHDDFRAICDTKARYCRCLDEKDWAGYADCFTPDIVLDTSGSGGAVLHGRDALVDYVRTSIGAAITVHQIHAPEIQAVDADTVDAIWAMQDRVIWSEERAKTIGKSGLTGFGHYRDRLVRCDDGRWRIAQSRLTRLHIDYDG